MTRRSNAARAAHDHYGEPTPATEDQLAGTMFAPATEPADPIRRVAVVAHTRLVAGAPRPGPAELRDDALGSHEALEAVRTTLVYVRARLLELYRSRATGSRDAYVTADDAARILDEWPQCPREIRELKSQAWRGTIFRGKAWARTGRMVVSKREHMHATDLPCWKIADGGLR